VGEQEHDMKMAAWMTVMAAWMAGMSDMQPGATSPASAMPSEKPAVAKMVEEAGALRPLVSSGLALELLGAVGELPEPPTRTVYRNREKGLAISEASWKVLPKAERAAFKPRVCSAEFFHASGYGSPLVYVRLLDLLGKQKGAEGMTLWGMKVMDFGFGAIGHLRAMAAAGAEAHGVEVEPLLGALYGESGDTGTLDAGKKGKVGVHIGRWPAESAIVKSVGGGYDVITSKNTLKAGYIHPTPPAGKTVDPKQTIDLGVDDAAFLKAVHGALKPGGWLVIYNICPAQSPAEDLSKPYIPWADGKSPYSKEQYEAAGFEVVVLDEEDAAWAIDAFTALGYSQGATKAEMKSQYFCWWTIARKKAS
jgi:hypothetical protein